MKSPIIKIASIVLIACSVWLASCSKDDDLNGTPTANKIAPDSASGGKVLTLTGSGLSDMRTIVFDNGNVPASFVPTFNTDNAIVFRVPDTANGGTQKIIFTNKNGVSTSVSFKVIALPVISAVSNPNFGSGRANITLTGNNLADVSKVTISKTTTQCTIISKSKKSLVIKIPQTNLSRVQLDITNNSGTATTTSEFINADAALKIFTEGYGDGFGDGSWGEAGKINNTTAYAGQVSFSKNFQKGNWSQAGFSNWSTSIDYSADYKFITFAIKGGSIDYNLWLITDASKIGFGNFEDKNKLAVKAGVWNYYKLPINSLDFWYAGTTIHQLGFRIQGPDAQDETFYFDDVLLVK